MKKHFYYLSLLLGLAISMTGFTSCCNDDDTTTPQQQPQVVTPSLNLDFASIDPQFVVNGENGEQYVQLTAGGSLDIPFKVEPAELASQIVLTSSDPSIVEVDGLKLNALKAGRVTITAKVGELEKSFDVVVQKFVDRDENGNLKISEINFPDENFRTNVKQFDENNDDVLTDAEIAEVTSISLISTGVESLDGIEFFTALKNLYCDENKLTSLDVSKNTKLTQLSCAYNQLTSLDLSKNTALTSLYCNDNQLTSLDVTKNTALEYLDCKNNQLTSLDVSGCTALTYLYCQSNKLTSFDVSKNTALTVLYCYENQLTSLDVSGCTALTVLDCSSNQLTSLDVTKNTALEELYCFDNQLTTLDVSKNTALTSLYCQNNQLTSLDVTKNTKLVILYCKNNQIATLDLRWSDPSLEWGLECDEGVVVTWPEKN